MRFPGIISFQTCNPRQRRSFVLGLLVTPPARAFRQHGGHAKTKQQGRLNYESHPYATLKL
jgi:hypothetical protein